MHAQLCLDDLDFLNEPLGQGVSAVVEKCFFKPMNKFAAVKKVNIYDKEKRHQLMHDVNTLL